MLKGLWNLIVGIFRFIKFAFNLWNMDLSIKQGNKMDNTKHIDEFTFGYDPVSDLYTWQKGKNYKLSDNFATYEFECKCDNRGCKIQKVRKKLVTRLQQLREQTGEPLRINSGYRCSAHQQKLRRQGLKTAKKLSQHELGGAVDIMPARTGGDYSRRFSLFTLIVEALFKAVGYGNGWLHVDLRDDKVRHWSYK